MGYSAMPDEIRSFNLQVIGLTTGGSAAGVLGGLVDDLLEFEVPAAVVESVEPRLREDLIEMFLYPPVETDRFAPPTVTNCSQRWTKNSRQ